MPLYEAFLNYSHNFNFYLFKKKCNYSKIDLSGK